MKSLPVHLQILMVIIGVLLVPNRAVGFPTQQGSQASEQDSLFNPDEEPEWSERIFRSSLDNIRRNRSKLVSGLITAPDNSPIQHARIILKRNQGQREYQALSKEDGSFLFGQITAGNYHLSVEKEGFPKKERDLEISSNCSHKIEVTLGVEFRDFEFIPIEVRIPGKQNETSALEAYKRAEDLIPQESRCKFAGCTQKLKLLSVSRTNKGIDGESDEKNTEEMAPEETIYQFLYTKEPMKPDARLGDRFSRISVMGESGSPDKKGNTFARFGGNEILPGFSHEYAGIRIYRKPEIAALRFKTYKIINSAFQQDGKLALIPASRPINSREELHQTTGVVIPIRIRNNLYLNIYSAHPELIKQYDTYEWRLLAIQAAEFQGLITPEEADIYYQKEIDRLRSTPDGARILSEIIIEYKSSTREEREKAEADACQNASSGFINGAALGAFATVALGLLMLTYFHRPMLRVSQDTLELARRKGAIESAEEERRNKLHDWELKKKELEIENLTLENLAARLELEKTSEKTIWTGNDYY